MLTVGERSFHLAMTALVLASTFLDRAMQAVLPAWNPPQLGLVTFVLGLIWVALGLYSVESFRAYREAREDLALAEG